MSALEWILALLPNVLLIGPAIWSEVMWKPPEERWADEARKRIGKAIPVARVVRRRNPAPGSER